jgi:hypothetical protein
MKASVTDVPGTQGSADDVQEEPAGIALAALDGLTLAEAFQTFVLGNEALQDKAQALGEAFPALRPWLDDFLAGKLHERIQLDATGQDMVERGLVAPWREHQVGEARRQNREPSWLTHHPARGRYTDLVEAASAQRRGIKAQIVAQAETMLRHEAAIALARCLEERFAALIAALRDGLLVARDGNAAGGDVPAHFWGVGAHWVEPRLSRIGRGEQAVCQLAVLAVPQQSTTAVKCADADQDDAAVRLWLREQFAGRRIPRQQLLSRAQKRFPDLSASRFDRLWSAEAPEHWKKPGRPRRN